MWRCGGAGNRVTAGKTVVVTRQMTVVTAFQFDVEMLTDWWLSLLVPIRVYFSRLCLRHDLPFVIRFSECYQTVSKCYRQRRSV
jgi:hypothetical protein